ncbi:MAG: ABC transporter substrate-binding protein [Xanthomonadales bacterium]|nr:ABC transporter substrate-binding protein [Xanthomonadales bacterium]
MRISRRQLLQLAGASVLAYGSQCPAGSLTSSVNAEGLSVLRIRNNRRLDSLDPGFTFNQIEAAIICAILPMLADSGAGLESYKPLDAAYIDQVDRTHIRFGLRPGLFWTNGFGPVTANDVKASYERIANPANNSAYSSDWAALDYIEVINEREGVIVLKEPFTPLLSTTLPGPAGAILPAAVLQGNESRNFGVDLPATAGPYRIKQWNPGQSFIMERNPDWNGDRPTFDEVHLILIVDDKAAEIAYDAGEVDATRLAASSLAEFESHPRPNSTIIKNPLHSYYWLGMRVDHPLYRDIRVRRAVQQAINIEELVEGAFLGSVKPATGIIAPGVIGYRQKQGLPPFDPQAAKRLLAEAGYPDGFKTIITTTTETELVAAATIVATQLIKIGIRAEVAPEENNSVITRAQGPLKYRKNDQMILWQYGVNPDPYWYMAWFTPEQIGKWNWERWDSKEFGKLARQGTLEDDPLKRQLIYERMAALMDDSGAYVFFANGLNAVIHRDYIPYKVRHNPLQPAFRFI